MRGSTTWVARQHDLGLGVTKAGVELQDLGALGGEHEATVEAAGVGNAPLGELGHDLALHLHHGRELLGRDQVLGNGRIDAHAAGVGALVAVEGALVVLRGGERHHGLAVGEREQRALGAVEGLLHDDGGTGLAERAREALVHAGQGLLGGLGHDHALARGQAVGLDHDRRALAAHVVSAGVLVGEAAVGGGGHARAAHDLLGKLLGALHLRRVAVGAKAGDSRGAHRVGDAGHERGLRANDNETNAVGARPLGHRDRRLGVESLDLLGHDVHATVAGRHVELARARGLGELGEKRVLAPAGAQKQDVDLLVHGNLLVRAPRGRLFSLS